MQTQNPTQDSYNFSAKPKVVGHRSKYREISQEEQQQQIANIMWDKRVVRGNTYAAIVTTSREAAQQVRTTQPRAMGRLPQDLEGVEETVEIDVSTPRAVEGRRHVDIVTDENVELLTDKPPNYEKDTQTEFIPEKPVDRLYMPVKTGEDRETQIWDGDIFNFDYEVEPILQVLIGKTLEQARMEVLEEEELKAMKAEQKRYDELRYAEMAEAQRMENEERRRLEENEKRKNKHRTKLGQNVESHKKLISRILAKEYLKNVRPNSLNLLRARGIFQDHFDYEGNNVFLPWVITDILQLQEGRTAITNTFATINSTITQTMAEIHAKTVHDEQERRRLAKEERERLERERQERRKVRAELRKKRDEENRRKLLQEKIEELLIAKGEQKENLYAQILSDMDSLGKDGMTVGLLGGIIGELLILFSTFDDLKKAEEEEDPLVALKNIEITKEAVQKIVNFVINELTKDGKVEIGITGDIEPQLQELDPELTLENIFTKPALANQIREILQTSINSFVLNVLRENAEQLTLNPEYIGMIVDALTNVILNPDEKAIRVVLAKAPLDYSQDARFEAIAAFMPTIDEDTPAFNLNEVKGLKSNRKGAKEPEKAEAPEEETKMSTAEVDYDDLVSVFPLVTEDFRVLAHHRPASIVFRRDVLLFMSSLFKDLDMKEIEVLKRVNNKAEGIEAVIASKFAKNLTVLVFDKN